MVSIPKPEDVTAYLAQYQIESVIEEAVNDAVLKQVKNPYLHIADLLVKHSKKTMNSGAGIEEESFSKAKFAEGAVPVHAFETSTFDRPAVTRIRRGAGARR